MSSSRIAEIVFWDEVKRQKIVKTKRRSWHFRRNTCRGVCGSFQKPTPPPPLKNKNTLLSVAWFLCVLGSMIAS